jgi:DNA-binding MarR family transcriptional regulator
MLDLLRRSHASGRLEDAITDGAPAATQVAFSMVRTCLAFERVRAQIRRISPLTPQERLAVGSLWELGPMPLGELSKAIDLSPPATSGLVDRLETRGVLERRPDPDDGRRTIVQLLDNRTAENFAGIYEGMMSMAVAINDLGQDDLACAARVMQRLHDEANAYAQRLMGLDDHELRAILRTWAAEVADRES